MRTPHRLLPFLLLAAPLAGCGMCGSPDDPPEEEGEESQEQAVEADSEVGVSPEMEEEYVPQRPEFIHEEPPTLEDFAVSPVEGPWIGYRGDLERSGTREVRSIRDPRVLWSYEIGIQGYGNVPIVTDDMLYVSSQGSLHNGGTYEDDKQGFYALAPDTGQVQWFVSTETDAGGLVLIDGMLYGGTDGGKLYAISLDGTVQWVTDVGCMMVQPPIVDDTSVYLLRREGIAMLNRDNGEPRGELGACRTNERGAWSTDGDHLYAASNYRPWEVYERNQLLWPADEPSDRMSLYGAWTPPILTESMLLQSYHRWPFPSDGDIVSRRAATVAFWRDNGQVAWVLDADPPGLATDEMGRPTPFLRSTPWIWNNKVFWTPNSRPEIAVHDVLTGEPVSSIALPDCRRRQFASIVGTSDMGYLARHDGVLYGFDPVNEALTWTLSLGLHGAAGGSETHSPVIAGCSEYPEDGTALFSTPAIGPDGNLYVGAGDGWIYAIADESWPRE